MESKESDFFIKVKDFITDYLPFFRKSSNNTIRQYKVTLRLWIDFLKSKYKLALKDMKIGDLSAINVNNFLQWLQNEKSNSIATLNLRLGIIKAFCKYLSARDPVYCSIYLEIEKIKQQKKVQKPVDYLSEKELKTLLNLPGDSSEKELRNKLLLILLYETGARVAEIINLKYSDFRKIDSGYSCILTGKGNKSRIVPISKKVYAHVESFKSRFKPNEFGFVFFTKIDGLYQNISPSAVYKIVRAYGELLKQHCDTKFDILHPHMLRHTKAMHLYKNGVPLELVSQILGHNQLETTKIYAFADVEMKRKAIQKAGISQIIPKTKSDKDFWNDESTILELCGLK